MNDSAKMDSILDSFDSDQASLLEDSRRMDLQNSLHSAAEKTESPFDTLMRFWTTVRISLISPHSRDADVFERRFRSP
jgi:hypothetical protein